MASRFQRGEFRDDNFNLLTVDVASAVGPTKFRRGDFIDANNHIVTTTVVAGSKMQRGELRAPSGALVVAAPPPTKIRQGDAKGANNEQCVIAAPQAGSGIRQGDARVLASLTLLVA